MPELPEVETTCRGIEPHLQHNPIRKVIVRQRQLRWPVPSSLSRHLKDQTVHRVERRAKYLLLHCDNGTLLIHLGMSGSLRLVEADKPVAKHDHVDLLLADGRCLRYTDPRRFGAILWAGKNPHQHELLANLGPEPLGASFNGGHLYEQSRGRKVAVKNFIMDAHVVVGVGNIYASESLYRAGIRPAKAAGKVSRKGYERLAAAIVQILSEAIAQGGTTLRDFVGGDGRPGYFARYLHVYGRDGEPCSECGAIIRKIVQGQRSTYYCPRCQH